MNDKISVNVLDILVCPKCLTSLDFSNGGATCSNCKSHYRNTQSGGLNLRLQQQKKFRYEFNLGASLLPASGFDFSVLPAKNNPAVNYRNFDVPYHLSKELMSYFPKANMDNALMLDLGCGNTVHRGVCEHAGFEYVGLDYDSKKAQILGDAHSLPFKDESFEFILSIAVLEHIQFPFVMMKEAYRVLKPNGIFIGTVAFLEPFHGDSFYHHTHLGTYNSLREGGFQIDFVAPSDEWSVLIAQAKMGLFPKMPGILAKSLVMPVLYIHKLWWKIIGLIKHKELEGTRVVNTTGAFIFIARRKVSLESAAPDSASDSTHSGR